MFKIISLTLLAAAVSAQSWANPAKPGQRVQYSQGNFQYTGTIVKVYEFDQVYIRSDIQRVYVYRKATEVGYASTCVGRICIDDIVHYKSAGENMIGYIHEVFTSAVANIAGSYTFPMSRNSSVGSPIVKETTEIGKAYTCVEDLCIGETLNLGKGTGNSTISRVFDNGVLYLHIHDSNDYVFKTFKEVGVSNDCEVSRNKSSCKVTR